MTIKTVYVAKDGTEFDDALACQAYEVEQDRYSNCGFWCCIYGITDEIEEVDFILFEEPAEMENFKELCKGEGLSIEGLPEQSTSGYYIWDYNEIRWAYLPVHLGDILFNHFKRQE